MRSSATSRLLQMVIIGVLREIGRARTSLGMITLSPLVLTACEDLYLG